MKIYKRDTKNKIRFLEVKADGADLVQYSGVLNTENVIEHRKTCKGKNIGKSNATTPEQQAISERDAKIKTKLSEGYFKTVKDAQNEDVILPMLAKDYKKELHKVDWDGVVYVQPKLDGMRCIATKENGKIILKSREGKLIETVKHIETALSGIMEGTYLDGELYSHGKNFQENMRLIKKYREGETEDIHYHVYDVINQFPFHQRVLTGDILFTKPLVLVKSYLVKDEQELNKLHSMFLNEGYEGTMIRHGQEGYKVNGRSDNLLKYKDFIDITLPVKDVIPNDVNPLHGSFIYYWKGATGHPLGKDILGCGMKFSHKEREEILKNKSDYIGKTTEVRFFEYSEDGVPRHPVCHGIRLDK